MMSEVYRKNSRWSQYFAVLPSSLDSLVLSPSELAELQVSAAINKFGKEDAEVIFRQKVEPLNLVNGTIRLFHQITSIIMANAFNVPQEDPRSDLEIEKDEELTNGEDQQTVLTMVPLADMRNTDAECNMLAWFVVVMIWRYVVSKKNKRQEIFNNYGPLPQSDLLQRYRTAMLLTTSQNSSRSLSHRFPGCLLIDTESSHLKLELADLDVRLDLARREDMYEDSYDIYNASSEGSCIPDVLIALICLLIINGKTLCLRFKLGW
jgi:SET domain-containing protein 6